MALFFAPNGSVSGSSSVSVSILDLYPRLIRSRSNRCISRRCAQFVENLLVDCRPIESNF